MPTEGSDPPTIPRGLAIGAALLAVGTLFVWAGWGSLFDGDLDRADLLGIVAVVCGVIAFLGGLMIVVGIAYHLSAIRRAH